MGIKMPPGTIFVNGWSHNPKTGTYSRCFVYKDDPKFHGCVIVIGNRWKTGEMMNADIAYNQYGLLLKSRTGWGM